MSKKMLIDATHAEETRVVVVDGNKVEEFDFETVNRRQLQGNIYLAKVTRVEPSLQAAFVDYGGNRHGFLAFAEIHPDYYQIPVADRRALLEEERALARAEEDEDARRSRRGPPRPAPKAAAAAAAISGMDVVDLGEETGADGLVEEASSGEGNGEANGEAEEPWRAVDHASDTDAEIESVAEEDVAEEIRTPRRPKPRKYKIQEVVKVRQIMLVQVVKEERGNKGAALTTYLSLAGRYCVLMPNTARGGGISRKITQAADRKKLKEIAEELEVPDGAGLIIRTAGAKRTKPEIKRDYEYLLRLWEQIRDLTLKSIAPAPIYEEGNLIKRTIRDLYSREIDEILVEGEAGYRTAKDFMKMIMPSHAKVVRPYTEAMPLFARYQVESYLASMFNPVVQLKSGGYIVIGVTEALVAIDVNSGRATKEGSIEDTALKTNLEAAEEIARQLRLRDLAGLIVIDFIDMEERKNNAAVEKRLKEKLKTDRARIQVGRISGFGLLEMSRQRLRPGMLESTTQPCAHCHGTGLIRSDDSMALTILRALEEEGTRRRSREVLLKAPVGIVNFLINQKREHVRLIETRYGMSVRIEADPRLVSPDYSLEKFKTATRAVPEPALPVVSGTAALMGAAVEDEADELAGSEAEAEESDEAEDGAAPGPEGGEAPGKKKRRRRRRRRGGGAGSGNAATPVQPAAEDATQPEPAADAVPDAAPGPAGPDAAPADVAGDAAGDGAGDGAGEVATEAALPAAAPEVPAAARKTPSRSRSRKSVAGAAGDTGETAVAGRAAGAARPAAATAAGEDGAPAAGPASRSRGGARKPRTPAAAAAPAEEAPPVPDLPPLQADPGDAPATASGLSPDPEAAAPLPDSPAAPAPGVAAEPAPAEAAATGEPAGEPKPRRRGWWSLGR
jgi:ribonuclease E